MRFALGVDIGGSSTKIGIVNNRGQIISHSILPTPYSENPSEVVDGLSEAIKHQLNLSDEKDISVDGIGIGIPGHLTEDGRISTYSNLHILDNFPLVDYLSERIEYPIKLDNDATLAALAESLFGGGTASKRLIVMTLGTGIGAGIIINGIPQRPIRGCIGDPGHIIINPSSEYRCGYGCQGCLETEVSIIAIERKAIILAQQYPDSQLGVNFQNHGRLAASDVIQLSLEYDRYALQIINDIGRWLGIGLASWCTVYDPDTILIGGGISTASDHLLVPLKKALLEYGAPIYVSKVDVRLARLGNEAGAIGAASLFLNNDEMDIQ